MKTPVNILYINGNIMKRGGIEAFMMNYFRHVDKSKIHIDFLVHGYGKGIYDDEIIAAGSRIFHVPTKSKHPLAYQRELKKLFKSEHFDIVHSHLDAMNGWVLKIAKKCGVSVRIAHSHNTDHLTNNIIKRAFNDYSKKQIPKYATHLFACSQMAGEWLFGEKTKFKIVNNAIELERFQYNDEIRNEIRRKNNWTNRFVIGHVGRFDYQKNQEYLVSIMNEVLRNKPNALLVFVGSGDTESVVKQLAIKNKVEDNIVFLGSREDVNELYNAFDTFVLPSRFEGLGIVAIEAQANGVPSILSDQIPKIVKINNNVVFLPLNKKERWIEEISTSKTRENGIDKVREAGYDIFTATKKLEDDYLDMVEKTEGETKYVL